MRIPLVRLYLRHREKKEAEARKVDFLAMLAERRRGRAGWSQFYRRDHEREFLTGVSSLFKLSLIFLCFCSRWNLGRSALRSPNSFR